MRNIIKWKRTVQHMDTEFGVLPFGIRIFAGKSLDPRIRRSKMPYCWHTDNKSLGGRYTTLDEAKSAAEEYIQKQLGFWGDVAVPDLLEALQPFVALLQPHNNKGDGSQPIFGINDAVVTVANLRTLRTIYERYINEVEET